MPVTEPWPTAANRKIWALPTTTVFNAFPRYMIESRMSAIPTKIRTEPTHRSGSEETSGSTKRVPEPTTTFTIPFPEASIVPIFSIKRVIVSLSFSRKPNASSNGRNIKILRRLKKLCMVATANAFLNSPKSLYMTETDKCVGYRRTDIGTHYHGYCYVNSHSPCY